MKHSQPSSLPVVSNSDAAMDRARRAMDKVAYAPDKNQEIMRAAKMLPDVTVMAGTKLAPVVAVSTGQQAANV
jgi:hypothetical protein